MTNKGLKSVVGATAMAALILGCAPRTMSGPSVAQNAMNAQRAAKNDVKPMSGAEADVIYKNYIDGIGKPVHPTSGLVEDQSR